MTISRWILLRMRNVSNKICRKIHNEHFMFNKFFFCESCHLLDNVERYGTARQATDDSITQCMCSARWITKATDTHTCSEYVLIISFPLQWLCKCTSILCYFMLSITLTLAPATVPKGKLDCYALNSRLCWPQSGSGSFEKQKVCCLWQEVAVQWTRYFPYAVWYVIML